MRQEVSQLNNITTLPFLESGDTLDACEISLRSHQTWRGVLINLSELCKMLKINCLTFSWFM